MVRSMTYLCEAGRVSSQYSHRDKRNLEYMESVEPDDTVQIWSLSWLGKGPLKQKLKNQKWNVE